MTSEEIDKRFDHHPPSPRKVERHAHIRKEFKLLAITLNALPESREKSVAMTHLEDGLMWANAAIARNPIE